jgi:hypothetical protein
VVHHSVSYYSASISKCLSGPSLTAESDELDRLFQLCTSVLPITGVESMQEFDVLLRSIHTSSYLPSRMPPKVNFFPIPVFPSHPSHPSHSSHLSPLPHTHPFPPPHLLCFLVDIGFDNPAYLRRNSIHRFKLRHCAESQLNSLFVFLCYPA